MTDREVATLPLHRGSMPRWRFDRMVDLSGAIAEVIVDEYSRDELLHRLARWLERERRRIRKRRVRSVFER